MADNSTQGGADTIRDKDRAGVKTQIFGLDVGIGTGTEALMSATNPMPTYRPGSATGTITSPALSLTSFTILASNAARLGAYIFNDSVNVLYVALAATASTTAFTVKVAAGGYYELPGAGALYTGIITGIALTASGNARVTELT